MRDITASLVFSVPSFFLLTSLFALASTTFAGTLDTVKSRDSLKCGVTNGLTGFSNPDKQGNWEGMDVDVCRAVAVAVLGDANKVTYVPTSGKTRFTALQTGEIDLLSRVTTWTLSRDTKLGLNFAGVNLYDGQGFMVRKSLGITEAKELNGASICMNTGTSTETNIADFFIANNLRYKTVLFEKSSEVASAYDLGRCDVYTSDKSGLAAQRLKMQKPDDHIILNDTISKEPLGPAVRHGDDEWFDVVKWTLMALIEAEELNITQNNINSFGNTKNPRIMRFLGTSGENGKNLKLNPNWSANIVKAVGNYGEIYTRNVGARSLLKIPRGLNKLWRDGGILYAIPLH
ncbi:MAG: general L-amino acid transport system substrate-binding protein [Cellvibrionaceae bacterium]|jgi:general L-amino acid transport system substrate-binding protein